MCVPDDVMLFHHLITCTVEIAIHFIHSIDEISHAVRILREFALLLTYVCFLLNPEAQSDLSTFFLPFSFVLLLFFFSFNRPFVEFVSAPFWSLVSTRFRQAKNILMMAILSWIIFTVAIGLIKPPPHSCWKEMNSTHQFIERVSQTTSRPAIDTTKLVVKRQAMRFSRLPSSKTKELSDRLHRMINSTMTMRILSTATSTRRRKTTRLPDYSNEEDDDIDTNQGGEPIKSSNRVELKLNSKTTSANAIHILPAVDKPKKTMGNPLSITYTNLSLVKPLASAILYDTKDVRNVFMVFLLLIIIGEFFSAPAITLAVSDIRLPFVFDVDDENRTSNVDECSPLTLRLLISCESAQRQQHV
jgi:hypothetical protein